jgi:hypothetical protein
MMGVSASKGGVRGIDIWIPFLYTFSRSTLAFASVWEFLHLEVRKSDR